MYVRYFSIVTGAGYRYRWFDMNLNTGPTKWSSENVDCGLCKFWR